MTARASSALPITARSSPLATGYVKGGGAWERDDYWATTIVVGTAYTARETRSGWTIGVGGEYAFTNFLSGFVEYNLIITISAPARLVSRRN